MAAQEDCRDYLRTGRCKYGASCKYRHPPNVQSGGGLCIPVNPSEPPFPIRRGEPTCQYYLKHGTCKFGQACKFHHPPQSEIAAAAMNGGNTVVMNVGRNVKGSGQQIVLNSINGTSGTTSAMALQFLPQRPDEPDCIYFLKNGRCKYGATCRYHHPVTFHQSKSSTDLRGTPVRRQPSQRPPETTTTATNSGMPDRVRSSSSLQMAAASAAAASPESGQQQHPTSQGYEGGQRVSSSHGSTSTPTHFVVTETPLAVVAGTANGPPGSYHRMNRSASSMGEDFSVPLNTSGSGGGYATRDYNSSSSSIASSYETATSTADLQQGQGELSNGAVIWPRPVKRIGSGGSLSAYESTPPLRPQPTASYGAGGVTTRMGLPPSVSDNSIASRRLRAESMGSGSDASGPYPQDAWNQSSSSHPTSSGWIEPSSSFEQQQQGRRVVVRNHQQFHHDPGRRANLQPSMRGASAYPSRRTSRGGETHDDGGLSMMTSALLNMLDTPEEAAMKSYATGESPAARMNPISPPSTPRSGHTGYSHARESMPPLEDNYLGSSAIGHERPHQTRSGSDLHTSRYDFTSNEYDAPSGTAYSPARTSSREEASHHSLQHQGRLSTSWSPTWQGSTPEGNSEQTNQSMLAMSHPSKTTATPPHPSKAHPSSSSNVGLYLP